MARWTRRRYGPRASIPPAIVDFSSNQSPLGAAPGVAAAVASAVVDAYPDPRAADLTAALAARHGVAPEQVVCGNGSTELIRLIAQLALAPGDVALALAPVFGECEVAMELAGASMERVPLAHMGSGRGFLCDESAVRSALGDLRPVLCWLCSPNNPTGAALPAALIAALADDHPDTLFVLDEAYCDLLPLPQWTPGQLSLSRQPHRAPLDDQVLGPRRPATRVRARRPRAGCRAACGGSAVERQRLRSGRRPGRAR